MVAPENGLWDVVIIGGGPAGSTAALVLARQGRRVLLLERAKFPRFHIGESFLARNFNVVRDLGLEPRLRKLPHMVKLGAEFAMGNGRETTLYAFSIAMEGGLNETFNIERASFDNMLLEAASDAGAVVRQDTSVRRIVRLADGDVVIDTDAGEVRGRYLVDASGQATVVGRHLGSRRVFEKHRKVAYFAHFDNVQRLPAEKAGYPTIVMCDEGWFWIIPLDEQRTSIGLVMDADAARGVGVPAQQMLFWGMDNCPLVAARTEASPRPESNHVAADFSYTCRPYAGPGYFLAGDAAVFLDPIFSTGACLGMVGGVEVAERIDDILAGRMSPARARRRYARIVESGSSSFFRLVNLYYDQGFRDMFLHGTGPLEIHRAVISVLAGHVFPKPSFAVRWRVRLFELFVRLHRYRTLVPRHAPFSLVRHAAERANVSGAADRPMSRAADEVIMPRDRAEAAVAPVEARPR